LENEEIKKSEETIEVIQTNESIRSGNIQVETKKGINKGLIITAIVLSVIAIAMVVFALVNKLNTNVYYNLYIGDINVGGMNEQQVSEAIKALSEKFKQRVITVKHNDSVIMELTPDSIDMSIDEQATINSIMEYGRTENIVLNNVKILKTIFEKQTLEPTYQYSEAKLTNISAEVTWEIEGRVKDDSFSLDEENLVLVITKGKSGKDIVVENFKEDIVKALKDAMISDYTLTLEERTPNSLDVDVVYAKVCREAKDAYVDETVKPIVYHKHELGIDFDKDELREVLNKPENQEEGKIIKFKLTATQPNVKIQDITKDIYKDKLGSYTSSFANSDSNRANNVKLGASMLNGTIVMPGETFSFNDVMGDCGLSSRGFKPAAVFKAGKVVQEVGGGICQISSSLYVAVLYANLGIVSRSNHALPVGYVPVSLDATIYYPYLDFKFKNTREYPIKIVATTTTSRKLTIAIYGTKEDKEYEVELTSWITSNIPSKVQKQNDSSLEKGKTKVIQSGTAGYISVAYKTVKYNGKVVSKVLLSEDSYGSTPKIIAVGTKEVVQKDEETNNNITTGGTTSGDTTGGETPGGTTSGETPGGTTSGETSGGENTGGTTTEVTTPDDTTTETNSQ